MFYIYRTHQGAGCDRVLTRSSKPEYAIEIKLSSAPNLARGNKIAFEDIGAEKNFIIVPEGEDYPLSENISMCSLKAFLEKEVKN